MPKKTRKEKILAKLHRQHSTVAPLVYQAEEKTTAPAYVFQSSGAASVANTLDTQELVFIKRDLLRTVVLSLVAIGVEILLYLKFGR